MTIEDKERISIKFIMTKNLKKKTLVDQGFLWKGEKSRYGAPYDNTVLT